MGTLWPFFVILRGTGELFDSLGDREGVKDLWEGSEIRASGGTVIRVVPVFTSGKSASSDSKAEGALLLGWRGRRSADAGMVPLGDKLLNRWKETGQS